MRRKKDALQKDALCEKMHRVTSKRIDENGCKAETEK